MTAPSHQRFFVLAIFVFLAMFSTEDCSVADIGNFVSALPTSYAGSSDPAVKAAESSDEAIKKSEEARQLANDGMTADPPDMTKLDKAIELRPGDSLNRLSKAAALRSVGKNDEAAEQEAIAYAQMGSRSTEPGFNNRAYHFLYALTLEKVYKSSKSDAKKAAAFAELCAQVRGLWRQGGSMTRNGISEPEATDRYTGNGPGQCGTRPN